MALISQSQSQDKIVMENGRKLILGMGLDFALLDLGLDPKISWLFQIGPFLYSFPELGRYLSDSTKAAFIIIQR